MFTLIIRRKEDGKVLERHNSNEFDRVFRIALKKTHWYNPSTRKWTLYKYVTEKGCPYIFSFYIGSYQLTGDDLWKHVSHYNKVIEGGII